MSDAVEVQLVRVLINHKRNQQTIHLRERGGPRQFSILIGVNEADEIQRKIQRYEPARPMTHDLIGKILAACGATLDRVIVSDLLQGTFHAKIEVTVDACAQQIDARPSDAIALATQFDAPIFVEKRVFDALALEQGG